MDGNYFSMLTEKLLSIFAEPSIRSNVFRNHWLTKRLTCIAFVKNWKQCGADERNAIDFTISITIGAMQGVSMLLKMIPIPLKKEKRILAASNEIIFSLFYLCQVQKMQFHLLCETPSLLCRSWAYDVNKTEEQKWCACSWLIASHIVSLPIWSWVR